MRRCFELNARGMTRLHELVLARDTATLRAIFTDERNYSIEPRGRSTMVLHEMLVMVSEFHTLINHLTFSRQSFFPKVEMQDVVSNMNELLAKTGGLVNVMDT